MDRKINIRSQNMCLPQVCVRGGGRRGSEATERGRVWEGVSPPTPGRFFFSFWGFKVSDLVHILGEFVGILSIQ